MSGGYVGSKAQIIGVNNYTKEESVAKFAQLTAANNFAQMPQVGGSPIVESGSNANGNWIKWADGTMICCANNVTTVANGFNSLTQYGQIWTVTISSTFSYPAAFIDAGNYPVCYVHPITSSGGAPVYALTGGSYTKFPTMYFQSPVNYTLTSGASVSLFAIGRWK